jgi:nucleotide-binding universal stress UspA family protein
LAVALAVHPMTLGQQFGQPIVNGDPSMRILLAIDGSPHSQVAVDEVARRPWPETSTIRVISVIQPYTPLATEFVLAGATLEGIRQQQASSAEEITRRAAEALRNSGLSTDTVVREAIHVPPLLTRRTSGAPI